MTNTTGSQPMEAAIAHRSRPAKVDRGNAHYHTRCVTPINDPLEWALTLPTSTKHTEGAPTVADETGTPILPPNPGWRLFVTRFNNGWRVAGRRGSQVITTPRPLTGAQVETFDADAFWREGVR